MNIVNQGGSLIEFILHYLDIFLFGSWPGFSIILELALHLCHEQVGFPVTSEKVVGPSTPPKTVQHTLLASLTAEN